MRKKIERFDLGKSARNEIIQIEHETVSTVLCLFKSICSFSPTSIHIGILFLIPSSNEFNRVNAKRKMWKLKRKLVKIHESKQFFHQKKKKKRSKTPTFRTGLCEFIHELLWNIHALV